MMLPLRNALRLAAVAAALLAPLPSFAIGRDLTPVRMVTPDYYSQSFAAGATETGFLLQWSSQTQTYSTTADAAGVPRMPASSLSPSSAKLFPNGDGYLALSQTGLAELDAGGAVRRNVSFASPLFFISAAFDGTNFFLLEGFFGTGYTGLLVDRNGHVLSTTKLPIPDPSLADSATDVAASANGGFSVIVGQSDAGVYAVRINAAGQVIDTVVDVSLPGGQGEYLVAVATNAGHTVAAWTTSGSAFVHTVELRNGSFDGDSILPTGTEVEHSSRIALQPAGDGFILLRNASVSVTGSGRRLLALRLDATGAPRDPSATLLLNGNFAAFAATSQTLVLLTFQDELNATLTEVSAAITDSGIVPSATYNIIATAVQQFDPSVASDGVDFFSAWLETTSTTMSVMAGRMSRSGQPLDGTGLVVAQLPSVSFYHPLDSPSVAFGGGVYLVVFASFPYPEHSVMGRRYARDGTPIDPAPFVITSSGSAPSVAFGGGRFLVAWQLTGGVSLAGGTVGSDGSLGIQQLLTPTPSQELKEELGLLGRPMIGWNGRHFVVAYDMVEQYSSAPRVRVLRADASGSPLDAHTIEAVGGGNDASIACSDQECLVSSNRADGRVTAVVHDDGTLHADAPKLLGNNVNGYAAIAFDGTSYLLAWRNGDSLLGVARVSRGGDPYALAVAGTINTIVNSVPASSSPVLATDSAGDTAIVTSELNPVWLVDRARFYFASELLVPRRRATGF